ncbi:MAG: Ig-like domain-containing protein [Bacteroidota bacterium]
MKRPLLPLLPFLMLSLPLLGGCMIELSNPDVLDPNAISPITERFKYFIQGKETSSLSEDRRTITLSLIAEDPDGGELSVEWSQDKNFGTFSSTRGKKVQWTANREGTYRVLLTATVRSSRINNDPDVASFELPVVNGKINAPEMAPEITLAPQTLVLFRALPSNLALSPEQLEAAGVRVKAQVVATTYIYDPQTNTKVKQSGDFQEIKWTSSDPQVAVVDDHGLVKVADLGNTGKITVTASSKTNSISKAACMVDVQNLDTKVEIKSFNDNQIDLVQRTPVDINAWIFYSNPLLGSVVYTDKSEQGLTWSSSDLAIAQVDENGRVTLPGSSHAGTVTITARSNYDPSKLATMSIQVK